MEQQVPDATTLLKFRHLMENNKLSEKIFAGFNACLEAVGYVHTITDTSANVHDIVENSKLIREDGEAVYGDS